MVLQALLVKLRKDVSFIQRAPIFPSVHAQRGLKTLIKEGYIALQASFHEQNKVQENSVQSCHAWVSGAACEPGGSVFRDIFLGWERGILQANLSGTWVSNSLCNRLYYTESCCFTAILIASSYVPLGFCVPGPSAQTEQRVIWSAKGRKEEEYIMERQCCVNIEQWCPCDSEIAIGGQQTTIRLV